MTLHAIQREILTAPLNKRLINKLASRSDTEKPEASRVESSSVANVSQVHELPMASDENVSLGVTSGDQSRHS